jgi:hypothetical protein
VTTACAWGQEASTPARLPRLVRRLVAETGYEIEGLGSWVSGVGYHAGQSDHDLRLVLPRGTNWHQAQQAWARAQTRLRELIGRESGQQSDRILRLTRLYPLEELMRDVESYADALQRFELFGQVPRLDYTGQVTPELLQADPDLCEGLYGRGAAKWRELYAKSKGALFHRFGARVYTGPTDLL